MNINVCPSCGDDEFYEKWEANRLLSKNCYSCTWKSKPYPPKLRKIRTAKTIDANQFPGFHYQIFDKFGHIMTSSRSYNSKSEAKAEIEKELVYGRTDKDAGPYTAVLWPASVTVRGEKIT